MKRRKAIKHLAILTSSMAVLPHCNFQSRPTFSNIPLDDNQWNFMEWLTNAILPLDGVPINPPETAAHFVLRMVNDCMDPKDIEMYNIGMQLLDQRLEDEYRTSYAALNEAQHMLAFTEMANNERLPEPLLLFLNTTKNLVVRHFTSSRHFMEEYLAYEFIPGRYNGCIAL